MQVCKICVMAYVHKSQQASYSIWSWTKFFFSIENYQIILWLLGSIADT